MAQTTAKALTGQQSIPENYGILARSFRRHLQAENKSPATVDTYMQSVTALGTFLASRKMPTEPPDITREHIEEWMIDMQGRAKAATVSTRFRGAQQFFKWLTDEGEISVDPMARMKRPAMPEADAPDVLTETQIKQLLKACDGTDFESRRDTAIVRLLLDTGMRRGELAGLTVADLELDTMVAMVMGKGRRPRACPFASKTSRAIDRYLRLRAKHPHAANAALWLGRFGPMTSSGVYQMVQDRAEEAGIGKVHPHQFRHTYAHMFRAAGGGEDDLMVLGGWRSRTMLSRYGRSVAAERAKSAHARYSPGEKF